MTCHANLPLLRHKTIGKESTLDFASDAVDDDRPALKAILVHDIPLYVDLDYETIGASGSMLMVTAAGTAVTIE